MRYRHVDKRYIRLSLSILIFVLIACSGNTIQPTEIIASITSTNTTAPPTSSNTKTAIPVPTDTRIVATRTPLPTLPAEAVDARVLELLKTNAGCSLPCWWEIIPGVTTTDEIQSFLEPFLGAVVSDVRYGFSDTGGHVLMRPQPKNGLKVEIQYLAEDKIVSMVYISIEMDKDIYYPVYDSPLYQEIMSAYTLEAMLTKYGKPDQILIRSYSELAAYNNPTRILLYYAREGIVAQYLGDISSVEQKNGTLINWLCPPKSSISLRLFNPDSKLSLAYLLSIDDNFSAYQDISKATNMDIDTFFQTYQKYNEKTLKSNCPAYLKTPWDLWPK